MKTIGQLREEVLAMLSTELRPTFRELGLDGMASKTVEWAALVVFYDETVGVQFEADFHDNRIWITYLGEHDVPKEPQRDWKPTTDGCLLDNLVRASTDAKRKDDERVLRKQPSMYNVPRLRAWLVSTLPIEIKYL